jgi:hypothetical protein
MTNPTSPKPTPIPAIIVYGRPTGPDVPQASWFRAEDIQAVKAAAVGLKLSVVELKTDAERTLTVGVHEGVLKGSGRMIVGSVTPEVYRRIEDYARKAFSAAAASKASTTEAVEGKSALEQTVKPTSPRAEIPAPAPKHADPTSSSNKPVAVADPAAAPPDPWDALKVGSHVIAKNWLPRGEPNGWWVAVITAIDANDFTIRWPDEPRTPPLKIERQHVAILHPTFDVTREWDRKR